MNHNLLLPWFPIVLATGVGARLLGSRRGIGLGFLCALFWIAVVQASEGPGVWSDAWNAVVLVLGSLAIIAIGAWSGNAPIPWPETTRKPTQLAGTEVPPRHRRFAQAEACGSAIERLLSAIEQFDDWLERHRNDTDPWPEFGEFIRGVLYSCCGATHVKLYRILSEGDELVPLREADPLADSDWRSVRKGIIGHVATTGRSYVAGDTSQGELIDRLAKESDEPLTWVFAVSHGARKIGVVTAGQLNSRADHQPTFLRCMELLIGQFWNGLGEACRSRSAGTRDPVTGLLSRESFFASAEHALQQAYQQGEPAVVAVIALEQLRHLSDTGRWEVADEVVREVGVLLGRKIRTDDQLGRFDGTRFLLFLRRVDSHLAMLILEQLMSRLTALCDDPSRWGVSVQVRCGVSGSGTDTPSLTSMMAQALRMCRQARINEVNIASDLQEDRVLTEAGGHENEDSADTRTGSGAGRP